MVNFEFFICINPAVSTGFDLYGSARLTADIIPNRLPPRLPAKVEVVAHNSRQSELENFS